MHYMIFVTGDVETTMHPFQELDMNREELIAEPRAEFEVNFPADQLEAEFEKWKEENKDDEYILKRGLLDKYATPEEWVEDWDGYYLNKEGTAYGRYKNPNGIWDWYEIGGRWDNSLILKNGDRVDSAHNRDIDWDAMFEGSRAERRKAWHDWKKNTDPKKHQFFDFGISGNDTFEEHMAKAEMITYGFIHQGKHQLRENWNGKTFVKTENWPAVVLDFINNLEPDEMVSVVDIHS